MMIRRLSLVSFVLLVLVGSAFASGAKESSAATTAKPELHFLWMYAPFDLAKDPGVRAMQAGTGYKVKWDTVPTGQQGQEQVLLKLSSGEQYDLVQVDPATFPLILKNQVAQPLDALVNQYGRNIKDQVPQKVLNAGRSDGKLYGLPRATDKQGIVEQGLLLARGDILKRLGLPAPNSISTLYSDLVAVKQHMPSEIPLSFESDTIPAFILSGFGLTGGWQKVDGKWVNDVTTPAYLKMVTFLHQLYAQGLLDPDMPAMTREDVWQRFSSGKAVFIRYDAGDYYMFKALHDNVPDANYEYLPVLKDQSGGCMVIADSGYNAVSFVPKDAQHAADAIKWINSTIAPGAFRNLYIGAEGQTFKIDNGQYLPIFPAFNALNKRYWYFALYGSKAHTYWFARIHKTALTWQSYSTIQKQNANCDVYSPLAYAPQFPAEAKYGLIVNQYAHDEVLKFIAGTRPLSQWNDFLAELNAKGETAIAREIVPWLDSNS